jgi:hypothetical protein
MKLKSYMLKVVKKWYCGIADVRLKHKIVVVMQVNAGENKSQDIINFFESVGVKNYFSTQNEQWQNGLPETAINSIMLIARTVMVESRLGGRFWFTAALAIFAHLGIPFSRIWVQVMNIFECQTTRERKTRAIEAINLGFKPNASCYLLFIPEKNCLMTSNQVKLNEYLFPS